MEKAMPIVLVVAAVVVVGLSAMALFTTINHQGRLGVTTAA